jgi:hypothetical protein
MENLKKKVFLIGVSRIKKIIKRKLRRLILNNDDYYKGNKYF